MNSKIKLFSLLASAIALPLSLVSALPAFSQSTETPPTTEQNRMPRHRNWLNLTPEQQEQMQEIRQNTRSQIDAILTDEQRAQLQSDRENHRFGRGERRGGPRVGENQERPNSPFESLNLTEDQRSRIEAVMQSSREQMEVILTDEQRQQLEQHRQHHQTNPQDETQP